jgi:hypothetical protein
MTATAEPSHAAPPTLPVFDLATIRRSNETEKGEEEERFPTNEWFTENDLQHPERYFERAAEIAELNRPEERRDTLEFFLAYREHLRHALERPEKQGDRPQILATIERYDAAIDRLRALIAATPKE